MKRPILTQEKIYTRVRDAIKSFPPEVIASMRVALSSPKVIDHLREKTREKIGIILFEHKKTSYQYSFWYGEKELYELMRQIL
jgi:hypothetical protein